MRRREFIGLLGGAATHVLWPGISAAQNRTPRIGVLVLSAADGQRLSTQLRAGLAELAYIDGRTVELELRSADGQASRLAELAAELVSLRCDVIVAAYTPCALAARRATTEIPIVAVAVGDPIGTGLVASLSRPGGNVTGLSNMGAELAAKSVELFRDLLSARQVGVLANPADLFTRSFLEHVELAGRSAGIEIAPIAMARGADELAMAFASLAQGGAQAVVVQGIFFSRTVADLAIKHRLPTASVVRSFADAGGLMSYGAVLDDLFRRSAVFVHKIVQGAKPADVPMEQPTKFEFVINMRTAKALGLEVPSSLLARADEVIE